MGKLNCLTPFLVEGRMVDLPKVLEIPADSERRTSSLVGRDTPLSAETDSLGNRTNAATDHSTNS